MMRDAACAEENAMLMSGVRGQNGQPKGNRNSIKAQVMTTVYPQNIISEHTTLPALKLRGCAHTLDGHFIRYFALSIHPSMHPFSGNIRNSEG